MKQNLKNDFICTSKKLSKHFSYDLCIDGNEDIILIY